MFLLCEITSTLTDLFSPLVAVNFNTSPVLYCIRISELALLVFANVNPSLAQWVETNAAPPGDDVYCLAVSGSNIFAGTMGGGVFHKSRQYGWLRVRVPDDALMALCSFERRAPADLCLRTLLTRYIGGVYANWPSRATKSAPVQGRRARSVGTGLCH